MARALGRSRAAIRPLNILYMNSGDVTAAVADLANLSGTPFSTVYAQGITGTDALTFASAAHAAGLKVVWDMTDPAAKATVPATISAAALAAALDVHPATYGFYIAEEPTRRDPVAAISRQLGRLTHPKIGTLFSYYPADIAGRIAPLLGLCDVISCAIYPIGVQDPVSGAPSLNISLVGEVAAAMRQAGARYGFLPALTIQAFSWSQDPTNAPTLDFARWPTRAEMTAMREQALDAELSHLLWFSRWAVLNAARPAARWADLRAAAGG